MRGPGQLGSIAAKANERVSVRAPPEAPAKNAGQREELQGEEGRPQPCPDRPGRPAGRRAALLSLGDQWGLTPPQPGRQKRHPKKWGRHEVTGRYVCPSSSQTSKYRSR